eukprot:COSAG03_NODE_1798_length_3505_cov_2.392543_2_plen_263_part_00
MIESGQQDDGGALVRRSGGLRHPAAARLTRQSGATARLHSRSLRSPAARTQRSLVAAALPPAADGGSRNSTRVGPLHGNLSCFIYHILSLVQLYRGCTLSQSQSQFIKDKRLHVNTRNIQRQLYPLYHNHNHNPLKINDVLYQYHAVASRNSYEYMYQPQRESLRDSPAAAGPRLAARGPGARDPGYLLPRRHARSACTMQARRGQTCGACGWPTRGSSKGRCGQAARGEAWVGGVALLCCVSCPTLPSRQTIQTKSRSGVS